ncbi:alpha/beta fold hydrolase [Methyloceanibacter sp.]|uniref:thioesterase domain-containing protein n=1 Tax=Methyloceanibacter sp. TaxID=1965321 RepID=UPI003D6D52B9
MITRDSLALGTAYEAPAGEIEKSIAGAFAEVFELDLVGVNDEFFDIGGDSLRGEVLSGLISERTKRDFQISDLIEHTTPRQIARFLGGQSKPAGQTGRPPIFLVHGRLGYTLPKPEFRQAFAGGQELFVFELPGIRGGRAFDRTEDIAAVYVAKLVEHYPQGPILIASFCVGALIALEMAAQLAAKGRPVAQLVLLDPSLPESRPVNVKRELKKKARKKGREPSKLWVNAQLLFHRIGAFANSMMRKNSSADLERFRERLLLKEQRGRAKSPAESIDARARLQLALLQTRPQGFEGPVDLLASPERDPTEPWVRLMPHLRVHKVLQKHSDISTAVGARVMQSIFDAALAAPPPARPERAPSVAASSAG